VLVGDVAPGDVLTPYVRWGDAFALGCIALVLARLAFALAPERRAVTLVPVASI
jgi:apolipoprotein N-acyltransferase